MRLRSLLGIVLAGLLASCTTVPVDFDAGDVGKVKGELLVFWVESDRFVYYPAPNNRLRYYLPRKLAVRLGRDYIEPGVMYTDGGSIPKPVQGFAGLSPWGYGPAYVVHDWMFIARRCIDSGQEGRLLMADNDQIDLMRRAEFQDSASVLAGIIAALIDAKVVLRHGLAPDAIIRAVSSGFAETLWKQSDPSVCRHDTPTATELRQIEAALGRGGRLTGAASSERRGGPERSGPESVQGTAGGARLISRQSF